LNGKDTEERRETDAVTDAVIGAAIEVHRGLGPGFVESVYERALCAELRGRGIEQQTQVALPVRYKNEIVGELRLDLIMAGHESGALSSNTRFSVSSPVSLSVLCGRVGQR